MDPNDQEDAVRAGIVAFYEELRENSEEITSVGRSDLPIPFNDNDAFDLADALQQNTHVTRTSLRLCNLGVAASLRLGQVLSRENTPVRKVMLEGQTIASASSLNTLLGQLKKSPNLEKLTIITANDRVLDYSADCLRDLFIESRTLRCINFKHCPLNSPHAANAICDGIAKSAVEDICLRSPHVSLIKAVQKGLENKKRCKMLFIQFSNSECSEVSGCLRSFFESIKTTISRLVLHGSLQSSSLKDVFHGLRSNKTISLLQIQDGSISTAIAESLGELLQSRGFAVKQLALVNCSLPDDAFDTIMKSMHHNRSIQTLTLQGNLLSWPASKGSLLELLVKSKNLKILSISDDGGFPCFTDQDFANVATGRGRFVSSLRTLDLCCMSVTSEHLSNLSMWLSRREFKQVKTLYLENDVIDRIGLRRVADLLQTVRLRSLHLPNTFVGNEGAVALAAKLRTAPCLGKLYLDATGIGDDGLVSIATAIEENRSSVLSVLSLKGNRFGDTGINALSDLIRGCTTLRELSLTLSLDISPETKDRFVLALDRNKSISVHEIEGLDGDMLQKIKFVGRRNKFLPLMDGSRTESLPGLWPHILATTTGSTHLDLSCSQFILREKLPWMLDNQKSRKRRAGRSALSTGQDYNWVAAGITNDSSDDSDTDEEELMQFAARMFGITPRPVTRRKTSPPAMDDESSDESSAEDAAPGRGTS